MTQPDTETAAETAAHLRLDVAVAQLLRTETRGLRRDDADARRLLDEEDTAYLERMAQLSATLHTAADRADQVATERARVALNHAATQHYGRVAAITAPDADVPSLLDQLLAAIGNSSNTGTGGDGKTASARSPIGIAALIVVTDIQQRTANHDRRHLATDLRAWAARPDNSRAHTDAETAEAWVQQARALLEPNPDGRRGLVGRCTRCGKGHVTVPDDTGEPVRRLALEVSDDASCRCLSCGQTWPAERARILAKALVQQREEDRRDRARQAATASPR